MKFTAAARELLKRLEGLRLEAYADEAGKLSIGYGHTGGIRPGATISAHQAEVILDVDLLRFTTGVAHLLEKAPPLNDDQFSALVIFAYNVGISALAGSTALRDIISGHFDLVPSELMRWCFVHDRSGVPIVSEGLLRRRMAEADLWTSGTKPREVA